MNTNELTLEMALTRGPVIPVLVIDRVDEAVPLARALLVRYPGSRVTGLEVDERQHAKNLAAPQAGISFVAQSTSATGTPSRPSLTAPPTQRMFSAPSARVSAATL